MSDNPATSSARPSPALFDDELRETLEMIATVVASVSGRVSDQTTILDRVKRRLPWFGLGAVVLALMLLVLLSRFIASIPSTCAVMGGIWTTTTTGTEACVFYRL